MSTRVDGPRIAVLEKSEWDAFLGAETYDHQVVIERQEMILSQGQFQVGDQTTEDKIKFVDFNCGSKDKTKEVAVEYKVSQSTSWTISGEYTFGTETEVKVGGDAGGTSTTSSWSMTIGGSESGSMTRDVSVSAKDTIVIPPERAASMLTVIGRTPVQGTASGVIRVIYSHRFRINDASWLDFFNSDSRSIPIRKYREFPVSLTFQSQIISGISGNKEHEIDCNDIKGSLEGLGLLESGSMPVFGSQMLQEMGSSVAPVTSKAIGFATDERTIDQLRLRREGTKVVAGSESKPEAVKTRTDVDELRANLDRIKSDIDRLSGGLTEGLS